MNRSTESYWGLDETIPPKSRNLGLHPQRPETTLTRGRLPEEIMAEFAARSQVPPVPAAQAPATAEAGPLGTAPRVQRLVQRAGALNAGPATVQLNGDGKDKKTNNKKQEKIKAAVAGKKKAKEKKINNLVKSVQGYDSGNATHKDVVKAVGQGNLSKMRTGHLSGNSSQNMNAGTRKTITGLKNEMKKEKK
jgi:hypothetical protein